MASDHTSAKPQKAVYAVTEGKGGKSFWLKIGVAFENRDGSLNLLLDALPVNGKLQVREIEEQGVGADGGGDEPNAADRDAGRRD